MSAVLVAVPRSVARRLRAEAEKAGLTLEEYLVELVARELNPPERAREYAEAARDLLEQARDEPGEGGARHAAEKLWGAAALAVEAYAARRDGKRPTGHRELREHRRLSEREPGERSTTRGWRPIACTRASTRAAAPGKNAEKALRTIEKPVGGYQGG